MLFSDYFFKHAYRATYQQRKNAPKSDFVFPERKNKKNPAGRGAYYIPDIGHARNALQRVARFGNPAEKARVRSVVCRRFPKIESCSKKK